MHYSISDLDWTLVEAQSTTFMWMYSQTLVTIFDDFLCLQNFVTLAHDSCYFIFDAWKMKSSK